MDGTSGVRVAIVTGAGSGIGRATAVMLGRLGWAVVLGGRRDAPLRETAEMIDTGGGRAICHTLDVAEQGGREALVDVCAREFGRVDALINNAGYAPLTPLGEMDADTLRRVIAVNTEAPISLARAAWAMLTRAIPGRVVNVSSMASVDPFPGLGAYGAAKAALNLATLAMTREGGGLLAFGVAPGAVETGMLRAIVDETACPPEACLSPEDVARVIVDCATGGRDPDAGATIFLPGPGQGERVVTPRI